MEWFVKAFLKLYDKCVKETSDGAEVGLVGRDLCKRLVNSAITVNNELCIMNRSTNFGDPGTGFINLENVVTLKKRVAGRQ